MNLYDETRNLGMELVSSEIQMEMNLSSEIVLGGELSELEEEELEVVCGGGLGEEVVDFVDGVRDNGLMEAAAYGELVSEITGVKVTFPSI